LDLKNTGFAVLYNPELQKIRKTNRNESRYEECKNLKGTNVNQRCIENLKKLTRDLVKKI
jgi:hypothetical protein